MAGEISRNTATRVDVANNTLTLDNFRELTVGRKHNLGTLKLVKDKQGNITGLRCSKHHFLTTYMDPSQKLSDAQELRDELAKVVDRELKGVFDPSKEEFRGLPQARIDELAKKQEKLLAQFKKAFMDIEHDNSYMNRKIVDGIQRSTIKTVVELLDGLKKLTAEKLLNYDVKTLAKVMVQRGVESTADLDKFNAAREECESACGVVAEASLDELKEVGNDFLRNCFQKIREVGENPDAEQGGNSKLEAINAVLRENGIETLHLDDRGKLAFRQGGADRVRVEDDFKKLFRTVILKRGYRRLNKALGGNLSYEGAIAALREFKAKLGVVDEPERAPAPDAGRRNPPPPRVEDAPAPEPADEFEDLPAPDGAPEIDVMPIVEVEMPPPVLGAPPSAADRQ